mgnify:CR=1 FL=1
MMRDIPLSSSESKQVAQLRQVRNAMLDALELDDWQKLGELDVESRGLIEASVANVSRSRNQVLYRELEQLKLFYASLMTSCREKRDEFAGELKLLNKGKKAVNSYHQSAQYG